MVDRAVMRNGGMGTARERTGSCQEKIIEQSHTVPGKY